MLKPLEIRARQLEEFDDWLSLPLLEEVDLEGCAALRSAPANPLRNRAELEAYQGQLARRL